MAALRGDHHPASAREESGGKNVRRRENSEDGREMRASLMVRALTTGDTVLPSHSRERSIAMKTLLATLTALTAFATLSAPASAGWLFHKSYAPSHSTYRPAPSYTAPKPYAAPSYTKPSYAPRPSYSRGY